MYKPYLPLCVVVFGLITSVSQATVPLKCDPHLVSLIYDPSVGNLKLHAAGQRITTLEIQSAAGLFTGSAAPGLISPPFDVFTPKKFFILKTSGIGDTDLGNVFAPGLTSDMLASDLSVQGSALPSGGIGEVILDACPEPSSFTPLLLSFLILAGYRRN